MASPPHLRWLMVAAAASAVAVSARQPSLPPDPKTENPPAGEPLEIIIGDPQCGGAMGDTCNPNQACKEGLCVDQTTTPGPGTGSRPATPIEAGFHSTAPTDVWKSISGCDGASECELPGANDVLGLTVFATLGADADLAKVTEVNWMATLERNRGQDKCGRTALLGDLACAAGLTPQEYCACNGNGSVPAGCADLDPSSRLSATDAAAAAASNQKVTVTKEDLSLEYAVPLSVPLACRGDGKYTLTIQGAHVLEDATVFTVRSSTEVEVGTPELLGYVETDKAVYKAGQTVRARIFVLSPSTLQSVSQTATVTARSLDLDIKLFREEVNVSDGFAEVSMPIEREQPVLGEWELVVTTDSGSSFKVGFSIEEYVLPKFEVLIDVDPTITKADAAKGVSGTVAGKFTYGEFVSGQARVELYRKQAQWSEELELIGTQELTLEGDAAAFDFQLVTQEVDAEKLPPKAELDAMVAWCPPCYLPWMRCYPEPGVEFGLPFVLKVAVTEMGSKVTLKEEATVTTAEHPLDYELSSDRKTFVAGLPFTIGLTATLLDGTAALSKPFQPGVPLTPTVSVRFTCAGGGGQSGPRPLPETSDACPEQRNLTCTAVAGRCSFTHHVPFHVKTLTYAVITPEGNMLPNYGLVVHHSTLQSASGSRLRLEATAAASAAAAAATATATATSTISVTASATTEFSSVEWHVVAAGTVVASGVATGFEVECASPEPVAACACIEGSTCGADGCNKCEVPVGVCPDESTIQINAPKPVQPAKPAPGEEPKTFDAGLLLPIPAVPNPLFSPVCVDQAWSAYPCSAAPVACTATFTIDATAAMAGPNAKLVGWIVRPDGELVPDHVELAVVRSLANTLSVSVVGNVEGETSYTPGAPLTISISAGGGGGDGDGGAAPAGSLAVGITAIDKSVLLLKKQERVSAAKVLADQAAAFASSSQSQSLAHARAVLASSGVSVLSSGGTLAIADDDTDGRSTCPLTSCHSWGHWGWSDNDGGIRTDMLFEDVAVAAAPAQVVSKNAAADGNAAKPRTRTKFPEMWIYDKVAVPHGGSVTLEQTAPDTMTSYIITAVGSSATGAGLAISDPTSVAVFQSFFLQMALPYKLVQGETFDLIVASYTYADAAAAAEDDSMSATVVLADSEDYVVEKRTLVCTGLKVNAPCSVSFKVRPTGIGRIQLHVTATASDGSADASSRPILVTPMGVEREYTDSSLIEVTAAAAAMLGVAVGSPEGGGVEVVEGSASVVFRATADIMGPTLKGIESLVRIPYGCGEQTMVTFGPMVSAANYLTATNQATPELMAKLKDALLRGYQRELTYRRADNGYSAFGDSDPESSLWLSAFVLRMFALADQYIAIDEKVLLATADYIVDLQESDGHWKEHGRVIHDDMKGGASNSDLTRSAYVTLALVEVRAAVAGYGDEMLEELAELDAAIAKAVSFLEGAVSSLDKSTAAGAADGELRLLVGRAPISVYGLCLSAFVLVKAESRGAKAALKMVLERKRSAGGMAYWSDTDPEAGEDITPAVQQRWSHRPVSTDIEATAYALLALVADDGPLTHGLAVSKWLAKQRSSTGGFSSTQDTVVGIESLSEYATEVFGDLSRMTVTIVGQNCDAGTDDCENSGFERKLTLNPEDYDVVQSIVLPSAELPDVLKVVVEGDGDGGKCLVSATVQWYEVDVEAPIVPVNTLSIESTPFAPVDSRKRLRTRKEASKDSSPELIRKEVCTRSKKMSSELGMGMVVVQLPSGTVLADLAYTKEVNPGAIRVEDKGSYVAFYLSKFPASKVCFDVVARRVHVVENPQPVYATAYSYYQPDIKVEVQTRAFETAEPTCATHFTASKCTGKMVPRDGLDKIACSKLNKNENCPRDTCCKKLKCSSLSGKCPRGKELIASKKETVCKVKKGKCKTNFCCAAPKKTCESKTCKKDYVVEDKDKVCKKLTSKRACRHKDCCVPAE